MAKRARVEGSGISAALVHTPALSLTLANVSVLPPTRSMTEPRPLLVSTKRNKGSSGVKKKRDQFLNELPSSDITIKFEVLMIMPGSELVTVVPPAENDQMSGES